MNKVTQDGGIFKITPNKKDPGDNHFGVSLVKSVFRMVSCGFLIYGGYMLEAWGWPIMVAGVGLFLAEVLGIIEEIV
tara:strand:+ start:715 stop:945 length:231 start_codon:yes stop_codon:yes gene_type:complete